MSDLTFQRCFNHQNREAAARCPECGRYFCRECVTEHDDRVLCAVCLNSLLQSSSVKKIQFRSLFRLFQFLLGLLIIWMFFYYLGEALISIPADFHEGTLWETGWWSGGNS